LSFLVNILSQLIQYLYNLTAAIGIPNYGLAIILFTIVIKLLLFPLTSMQIRSMRVMQELQPQLQAIPKE
jgi:YidC/Oxa1 family membrane protein insertase